MPAPFPSVGRGHRSSAAHLADWTPPVIKLRNGRTRVSKLTRSDVQSGNIVLHLCPDHHGAFDAHLPCTKGGALGRDWRNVDVSCSCGTPIRYQPNVLLIGKKPSLREPHRAWWEHLPAELKEYATR